LIIRSLYLPAANNQSSIINHRYLRGKIDYSASRGYPVGSFKDNVNEN
jgi:hypothetical protein